MPLSNVRAFCFFFSMEKSYYLIEIDCMHWMGKREQEEYIYSIIFVKELIVSMLLIQHPTSITCFKLETYWRVGTWYFEFCNPHTNI